jgi:hypothetical protein
MTRWDGERDNSSVGLFEPLQEDAPAAREAATDGMEKALRAERVALWKLEADHWLSEQASGYEITADDIVRAVGLPDAGPARNNVVGAWFGAKSKAGVIVFAGKLRKSQRVIGHGNLLRVWKVA